MAYLGQGPFQEFSNPPTKDSFTGDGSTVVFDMDQEVPSGSQNALEVFVDNVRQEPGTGKAFILGVDGSGDHKRITFSTAPSNGSAIYVINDKTNSTIVAPLSNDLNGTELILDVDGDTSITADTDDRIDFKIANTDHISIGTSSGDTIIKPMVDAKDIMFQQYDGRDVLEINDAGYVALHNGTTGSGQLRIYEDDDNGANFTAFQVGTQAADITYTLPTADGSSGQAITTNGSGVLTFSTVSANVPTSADGQALGSASLEWSDLFLADGAVINFGADQDINLTHVADTGLTTNGDFTVGDDLFVSGGVIDLKNTGTASQIHLYCESSNAHAQIIQGAPHSQGASNTLILPDGGNGTLLSTVSTATVTNKTFTSPKLNEDVAVTTTATELNLIDGGTSRGTTAIADGDGVLINDGGTMRMTTVQTLAAYLDDEITAMPNLVTTAATTVGVLGSGSIAAGFGAIDNGASNITTGGLVSLDVDADADDVTGDSATGRLTLGAGQDLNLYHGGTNSYIVNDTGDLILKTGASDEDMIFQGNDGGSAITALTLDMSAAGAATFNSTVAATGFIIGSANIGEAELEILDGLAATTAELTIIDGNTSATGTTVADADRVVMNDNGTMVQVAVTDLAAYFDDEITAMPNLVTTAATTVGALDSGSITSGFGTINNGSSTITTTGALAAGAVTGTSFNGIPFFSGDTGSIYTTDVSGTDDTATGNSAYGYQAMDAITTGDNNVAIGRNSLGSNTTGATNTAIGSNALAANTTTDSNTAVGRNALTANTAAENTALGYNAAAANTSGVRIIAIGKGAYDGSDTENDNMAIGHEAMTTNTAGGTGNLAIGNYTLDALTSGDYNVGVGLNVLSANTTGGNNVAVGQAALLTSTTASNNTALGHYALLLNTTGANNVAVGSLALDANTTADGNTAVGQGAMSGNTTGANNIAIGLSSLYTNTTGASNTALGQGALFANTTADLNTAVGFGAMYANTTGTRNIGIGANAYNASDTESDNVAVGYDAMTTNTAGGQTNVAIGNYALNALTSGDNNTAVGHQALTDNTTALSNTAIGHTALATTTTGGYNTAVGYEALNQNNAAENTAVGVYCMKANTTGVRNTAIGHASYTASDTESDNIAIGYKAMHVNTAGGNQNVALGNFAADALTSADNNVVVGHNAGTAINTGGNNVAVGHSAGEAITSGTENVAVWFSSNATCYYLFF